MRRPQAPAAPHALAGAADDITPRGQVFAAKSHVGTLRGTIDETLVPGGHIGLFTGSRAPREAWPQIARWIARIG
jgi:poly(3-hydroxyalkanoate) synthetase